MVKVPLRLGQDLIRAMSQQGESSSTKTRVLFVDDEMYGPLEFPKSFILGCGQVLKLAAYGKVQVTYATIDILHCTKEINEDLYNGYKRNPPTSDIDFTNDPNARGIGANIARSFEFPSCSVGKEGASNGRSKELRCPNPTDARVDKTPARFL